MDHNQCIITSCIVPTVNCTPWASRCFLRVDCRYVNACAYSEFRICNACTIQNLLSLQVRRQPCFPFAAAHLEAPVKQQGLVLTLGQNVTLKQQAHVCTDTGVICLFSLQTASPSRRLYRSPLVEIPNEQARGCCRRFRCFACGSRAEPRQHAKPSNLMEPKQAACSSAEYSGTAVS